MVVFVLQRYCDVPVASAKTTAPVTGSNQNDDCHYFELGRATNTHSTPVLHL